MLYENYLTRVLGAFYTERRQKKCADTVKKARLSTSNSQRAKLSTMKKL